MNVETGEFQQNVTLEAGDPIFDMFLYNLSIYDGIETHPAKGPIVELNGNTYSMKSISKDVEDVDAFDFMFPKRIIEDSFDITDKTNEILSKVLKQIHDYLLEQNVRFLVLYGIRVGVIGDSVKMVVRMYHE